MRFPKFWLAVSAMLLAIGAQAQPTSFQEGSDYVTLGAAQPTDAPKGTIDVMEFFSYHCPHCAALDPKLNEWIKTLPKDVYFHRSPVIFQKPWINGASLYYGLVATKQVDKFHANIFKAVHEQHMPILSDPKALSDWIVKGGGDATSLNAAMNSFSGQNYLTRSQNLAQRDRKSVV